MLDKNTSINAELEKIKSKSKRYIAAATIVVPGNPPSANRYWRFNGKSAKPLIPKNVKEFKEKVWLIALSDKNRRNSLNMAKKLPIFVKITWVHRKRFNRADLDNKIKIILDALEGIAYENDNQIEKIEAERHEGSEDFVVIDIFCRSLQ